MCLVQGAGSQQLVVGRGGDHVVDIGAVEEGVIRVGGVDLDVEAQSRTADVGQCPLDQGEVAELDAVLHHRAGHGQQKAPVVESEGDTDEKVVNQTASDTCPRSTSAHAVHSGSA